MSFCSLLLRMLLKVSVKAFTDLKLWAIYASTMALIRSCGMKVTAEIEGILFT